MREPIKFQSVTTQVQFDALKEFAKSDGYHLVDDTQLLPIVTMSRGDRQFGYFHVITHPIASFAFHLGVCEAIDFKEAAQQVTAHFQLSSLSERFPNGTAFIATPPASVLKIDPKLIEKLGYKDLQRTLWQSTPQ